MPAAIERKIAGLAWLHTLRSVAVVAAVLWLNVGTGRAMGVPDVPWWIYPVPLLVVGSLGTTQVTGKQQFHRECSPAVTVAIVLSLSPLQAIAVVGGVNLVRFCVLRTTPVKLAFNVTRAMANLGVQVTVQRAVLGNVDALGGRGLAALILGVVASEIVDGLTSIAFMRRIGELAGEPDRHRFFGRQLVSSALIHLVIGVAVLGGFRGAHSDGSLWWLPVFMSVVSVALMLLGYGRSRHRYDLADQRAWLDAVRGSMAVREPAVLAERLIRAAHGSGVRFELGEVFEEAGRMPAARVCELIRKHRSPAPASVTLHSGLVSRIVGRAEPSVTQVPVRVGDETGYLLLSHENRMFGSRSVSVADSLVDAAAEISQAIQRESDLRRLDWAATRDVVTGLLRPGPFVTALDQVITGWRRTAVLLVNVGRLRQVNDVFGRDAGDDVLRRLALEITAALPAGALVSRLSGHLFAVALPVASDAEVAAAAEVLMNSRQLAADGPDAEVTLRVGISCAPDHGSDGTTLLRRAQLGLDQAETDDVLISTFSWESDARAQRQLRLANDLRLALDKGEIWAAYQPQVDPNDGRVLGVEALARWIHPDPELGFIPPDEFVRLAESTGLVRPLTERILRLALEQHRAWAGLGLDVPVSVNLSARSLSHPTLVDGVAVLLAETGVAPDQLTLEVTETAVMDQPVAAVAVLQRLRELGIRISLDDFGTGHSSLAYLRELPADEVKLDRAFTSDLADVRAVALVRASVELAHTLGLSIVAEGVEDEATLVTLRDLGVDVAQGYHICRPARPDVVTAWLSERSTDVAALHRTVGEARELQSAAF